MIWFPESGGFVSNIVPTLLCATNENSCNIRAKHNPHNKNVTFPGEIFFRQSDSASLEHETILLVVHDYSRV